MQTPSSISPRNRFMKIPRQPKKIDQPQIEELEDMPRKCWCPAPKSQAGDA